MDNTGEQLHPNWRALATIHIPIKRFIKEGSQEFHKEMYENVPVENESSDVRGCEIKEFYEDLVAKQESKETQHIVKEKQEQIINKIRISQKETKQPFDVRNYFRYAMTNKVNELLNMDFTGGNVNECDSYGWTSLMMAVCEGAYEAVEYLLELGVDKYIKDKTGKTAQDLALKKGYLKIAELLEKDFTKKRCESGISTENKDECEPFYCDICKLNFTETSLKQHQTSTIHQFNVKSDMPVNKLQKFNISVRNKGLQLMVKQGWDKESGLGPSHSGRLYPIKTVIRKQRTGLGTEQEAARITHFEAFDHRAVQRHNSDYYKNKSRNRNDIKREKVREWKRDRRLRNELN